jgi:hypothetical protein
MNIPFYIENNPPKRNVVLVTAFFELGRETWKNFARPTSFYLESFCHYLKTDEKMFIFVEPSFVPTLLAKMDDMALQYPNTARTNKHIIPMDKETMKTQFFSWQQFERIKTIMTSPEYIQKVGARRENGNPEVVYPEYNCANHAKMDFLSFVIQKKWVEPEDILCWTDFGYHYSVYNQRWNEYPTRKIDSRKFNPEKWNFLVHQLPMEQDFDPEFTLAHDRVVITCGFFGSSMAKLKELIPLYHACLEDLLKRGIADDDQHVYLRCFLKCPEQFALFGYSTSHKWPEALTYFQITDE